MPLWGPDLVKLWVGALPAFAWKGVRMGGRIACFCMGGYAACFLLRRDISREDPYVCMEGFACFGRSQDALPVFACEGLPVPAWHKFSVGGALPGFSTERLACACLA